MKKILKYIPSVIMLIVSLIVFSLKKPQVVENTYKNEIVIDKNVKNFKLPVKRELIISSKQCLREPIEGLTSGIFHNAWDIVVPEGTPVYAAKEGTVVTCYPSFKNGEKWLGHSVYGGYIEIMHEDGTMSTYGHLSYTCVRTGQRVELLQQIGESGGVKGKRGSGTSTGPHLHFSIILLMDQFIDLD